VGLELRILGPVGATRDGAQLRLGPGQRALLAALAVRAGEVVTVSRLVDDLWGDSPPDSAVNVVHGYVSDLRKALGRDVLRTHGRGYRIEVATDALDAQRFESLFTRAEQEGPAAAAATLRDALALWRGSPLVDVQAPFVSTAAARLDELRLLALERRLEADIELGRQRQVVGELEALVAEHPARESLCALLMIALYGSGRQADALAAYRTTRTRLVEYFGLEPGPALQSLQGAILRHDVAHVGSPAAHLERSILAAVRDPEAAEALLAIVSRLARQPPKELILVEAVDDSRRLGALAASLRARCDRLADEGVVARAAPLVSQSLGGTLLALASQQEVDLLVVDGSPALLSDEPFRTVLAEASCDVAVLVARASAPGPVLVPFVGAEHDWAAIELGAWVAGAQDVPLLLAGPVEAGRDASLLLANASLAVQRALGVVAEPLLLNPSPRALVRAAEGAGMAVVGLPHAWRSEGVGEARRALALDAGIPVLLVRKGLRPGGLAPRRSLTRFTWSLRPP
jgi:DNA-binding SARP family transcriptional activator